MTLRGKAYGWVWTLLAAGVLSGCAGTNQWADPPDWVSTRPALPGYYIGISSASKAQYGEDAAATAQKRALADLSGQIRVVIESTSILHTTQFQGVAGQNFSERIQSASTEDLEGYELVASYENETDQWAYYRLNQATYERIRQERKRAVMDVAGGYWVAANEARAGGRPAAALDFYVRALESMEVYWGELNQWDAPSGSVNVDRACLDGITQTLASLKLTAAAREVNLSFADRYSDRVECTVLFDDAPAAQIPVWSRYNRGTLPKTGTLSTDATGTCSVELGQFEPGVRSSELRLELRLSDLVPRLAESPVNMLIKQLPTPSLTVPIFLASPSVFLSTTERVKGKEDGRQVLRNAIAQGLSSRGIDWVESRKAADLILELDADTREAGSAAGFFTVMLNASAVLKTPDGRPVLQQNLEDVKGVQLNWEAAHAEAYRKAQLEIQGSFLKKLIQALYQ
jgi:hypothetical protein